MHQYSSSLLYIPHKMDDDMRSPFKKSYEYVEIICYRLGPSVGTWVLPITHRTWGSGFEQENKATDILKIGVMRICCEAE